MKRIERFFNALKQKIAFSVKARSSLGGFSILEVCIGFVIFSFFLYFFFVQLVLSEVFFTWSILTEQIWVNFIKLFPLEYYDIAFKIVYVFLRIPQILISCAVTGICFFLILKDWK